METVLDYNPTQPEIEAWGFLHDFSLSMRHGIEFADPLTSTAYREAITMEAVAFDLYLLFSGRGDQAKADVCSTLVSTKVAEYRRSWLARQSANPEKCNE